jgi:hypothetical protein
MRLALFDNTPAGPGEKHGEYGPTHCGNVNVDYEYQIEMWVSDIDRNYPMIVRAVCLAIGRTWARNDQGRMVEVKHEGIPQ